MDITSVEQSVYMNTNKNIAFIMKAYEQDDQPGQSNRDSKELYDTISSNDEVYENVKAAVVNISTSKQKDSYPIQEELTGESPTEIPRSVYKAVIKLKEVVLLIFAVAGVVLGSLSLSVCLTSKETADILCLEGSNKGQWSVWGSWEYCSATCDVGLQGRHRNCSSPSAENSGGQCIGKDNEQRLCLQQPCHNGGWSVWGSWGSCSTSCNIGLQSRSRTCTNPKPSPFGSYCAGDNTQVAICENETRPETHVAFNVYSASVTGSAAKDIVVFTTVLLNEGGAYNDTDGIFTAPYSGLYQFNGQICTAVGRPADYEIKVDGKPFASGEYMTPLNANDTKCSSFSAVAPVKKNEKVWIESLNLNQFANDWNSFSGILIHKI